MPSKKVLFCFAAFSSQEAIAPLGILVISTPLLRAGYEVRSIDSPITPQFQKRALEETLSLACPFNCVRFDWSIQASTNLVERLTVEELNCFGRRAYGKSRRAQIRVRR